MSLTQSTTALSLIRYGVGLQLAGLLWGPIFPMLPYPRMGLTVHIQCMSNGVMALATGLLLYQHNLLKLGQMQLRIVKWGFILGIAPIVSEVMNTFWGAKEILPLAAAGSEGASQLKEMIVTLAHVIPSPAVIVAVGVLLWHLPRVVKEKKVPM